MARVQYDSTSLCIYIGTEGVIVNQYHCVCSMIKSVKNCKCTMTCVHCDSTSTCLYGVRAIMHPCHCAYLLNSDCKPHNTTQSRSSTSFAIPLKINFLQTREDGHSTSTELFHIFHFSLDIIITYVVVSCESDSLILVTLVLLSSHCGIGIRKSLLG